MSKFWTLFLALVALVAPPAAHADPNEEAEGFRWLFDGKTLNGWEGNPELWSVEDGGEIVGRTTDEKPIPGNTFLIWRGGTVADFETGSTTQLSAKGLDATIVAGSPSEDRYIQLKPPGSESEFDSGRAYIRFTLPREVRPEDHATLAAEMRTRAQRPIDITWLALDDRGRLVTAFLENFFRKYVEYDFTADLEEKLDEVSAGELQWKALMREFWKDFNGAVGEIGELRITEVLDTLNEVLGPHIFPAKEDGADPRLCPLCGQGQLSLREPRAR